LSDRELEVFDLISRNRSVAEIAESMQLSRKTVEHHRRNIRVKLRLHNAVALQRYASEWAKQSQR
jgi:two-component system nitrate/nitrite response regulator NarL